MQKKSEYENRLASLRISQHLAARRALLIEWHNTGLHKGVTLGQAIARSVSEHPRTRIVFGSLDRPGEATIAELFAEAERAAAGLAALGFTAGDRLLIHTPSWREGVVAFCAAAHLGVIIVPVIPFLGVTELSHIARITAAKGVLAPDRWGGQDFAAKFAHLAPDLLPRLIVIGDGPFSRPTVRWSELLGHGRIETPVAGPSSDPCLINFTSGTTALPKGVVHSHDSLVAEVPAMSLVDSPTGAPMLWPLPAGHIAGVIAWLRAFLANDPSILIDRWSDELAVDLIRQHRPDRLGAAPFHMDLYLRNAQTLFEYGVRHVPIGAASIPPVLIERAQSHGLPATRLYGCTEFPSITGGWPDDPLDRRAHTDGRALRGVQIRIVDEAGRAVPPGTPGEIEAIGPELFLGYLEPEHNASAFSTDGWFRTGDVGVMTEDGYLTIVDRLKDIVIRGGENISSKEVEDVLLRHPAIAEAAVVAWPHERLGEQVAAFVVLRPTCTVALHELSTFFISQGMALRKTPEHLIPVDTLPRNSVGKIMKGPLREKARELASLR